jgi:hypothetical protein
MMEHRGSFTSLKVIVIPSRLNLGNVSFPVVISKATRISSFKTGAVNEMETIFRHSFSHGIKDIIMIVDPKSRQGDKRVST